MAKRGRGRPRKTVSGDGADFFKVILRQPSCQQLMIPPDFVKDFKRTMREKVILKDVDGKTWHVDVKETRDGVFLQNGWQSFATHHCLKLGEFLVFEYEGSYTFTVKILGTSGCKKETLENIDTNVIIKRESVEEIEEDETSSKRPRIHKEDHLSMPNERFGEENELQEPTVDSRLPENAERDLSECPFFVASHVGRKDRLRIPNELVDKHNLRLGKYMFLHNADGKVKRVTTFSLSPQANFFGHGWSEFQKENKLGSNDRCKFTFESLSPIVNVQILPSGQCLLRKSRGRPRKIASDNLVQEVVKSSGGEAPYSNNLPEFFKLHIPELFSHTLRIPPAFIKKFDGNIPKVCTLKAPAGVISWQVDMNKLNDHWYFQKGWPEFVQDNSLEDKDFLTFSYAGNSTFYVKVFSRNCCRKIAENVDDEILQETKACPPVSVEIPTNNRRSLVRKSSMEKESVVGNPSFSMGVTKSQLSQLFLTVPMKFWRTHLIKYGKNGSRVALRIKDNKWMVNLRTRGDRITFVSGDLPEFFGDNSLKPGTSCTFQLIDANDLAFQVTVLGDG